MIKLKNIKIDSAVLSCDIVPEDSELSGYIKIDTSTQNCEYSLPQGYGWCRNHIEHAKDFLIGSIESKNALPSEALIMWY